MPLYHIYTNTYILVYTIPCKLEYDVFEMRSDEHKTTAYLDVIAGVRCYKLKSSNIYIYIYYTGDGHHSVFHQ